jgi:hypothetical protein
MPGILKDRFIVILLMVIVVALGACFSFYIWQLYESTQAPAPSSPADLNAKRAISLALNDTAVTGKVQQAWYTMVIARNGTPGEGMPDFHIVGVTASSFHGADIVSPAMPAVEIAVGDTSDSGVNIYAFMDLQKGRVAYIGFAPRPGANADGVEYSTTDYGVAERIIAIDSTSFLDNVTIVDAGYSDNSEVTDQNNAVIVNIALDNGTIKSRIDGRRYDATVMMAGQEDRYHIISYPVVRFTVYKKDGDGVDFYLFAAEDPVNKKIRTTEASTADIRPPQFPIL